MDDQDVERLMTEHYELVCSEALELLERWRERLAGVVHPSVAPPRLEGDPRGDPRVVEALRRVFGDLELVADARTRTTTGRAHRPPEAAAIEAGPGVRAWAPAGLLPDDPDLYVLLDRAERRVLQPLAAGVRDPIVARCMPAPVSDGVALLAAYRELSRAVPRPGSALRLSATNGRWRLVGLHVIDLPERPLALLQAALMELSAALASPPLDEPRDATRRVLLRLAARAATTPDALVGDLARVLALLDMPADRATLELRSLLAAAPMDGLRLDHHQAELYRDFAQRTIPLVLDFHRVIPALFDDGDQGR